MNTEKRENSPPGSSLTAGIVDRVDRWLQKGQEWAIFSLLIVLVASTFLQVVLRNLPGNPSIPWIDLAMRLFVLWVGLLGASLAVARDKHISIDIAARLLPPGPLRWVKGLTGALSLVVIVVLVHASLVFTLAKHEASAQPLFRVDTFGLAVHEWFFTDLVPVIFLILLWHTWVAWSRNLGDGTFRYALSRGTGVILVVLLACIAAVDLGFAELSSGAGALEQSFGALLKSAPFTFIALTGALALLGAPLYVVIAGVALLGHFAVEQIPVPNFIADGYGGFRKSTIFLAIPLFTLAGYLMAEGNTPKRLVGLFRGFLGWMPGGVAIVALIACSFFTAFTGASGVTIIALGGLLLPILLADRYPENFALGLLTTGGSRGLIFPPAIPVFLLAMIMGLSWDAVTATGPFGSAVMDRGDKVELCKKNIEQRREELAWDREMSGDSDAFNDDLDDLLDARMEKAGLEVPDRQPESGRDEFELGDDDMIEAAPEPEATADDEPVDEFELGDDEMIEPAAVAQDAADEGVDEFELGDDPTIAESQAPASGAAGQSSAVSAPLAAEAATIAVPSSTQIFTAGLIPGILMVVAIAIYCIIMGFGGGVVRTRFTVGGAGRALLSARYELPIPIIIGVGIFGGFFTPAEAASATAAYTLLMQLVLYRDFGLATLKKAFVDSMVLVGGILIILIAAMGMLNFLVVAKVPDTVLAMIENIVPEQLVVLGMFSLPRKIIFLLMLNVFLLVVGCLMDIFSAILVVLPLLLPISYRFGIHPAHLAVIFLTNLEIGYSTPPVGINLFVASLRFDRPVVKLYAASLAFLAIMFTGLMLITYWPDLSLWLVELTGVH